MGVPVVAAVQGHHNEGHPVPLGGGDQAASRLFGEAGLDADGVRIEGEQAVVVQEAAPVGRVAVGEGKALWPAISAKTGFWRAARPKRAMS